MSGPPVVLPAPDAGPGGATNSAPGGPGTPGGTAAPPDSAIPDFTIDPNLLPAAAEPVDPVVAQATSAYIQMFGEDPPPHLIESLRAQGLSLFDMLDLWRHKPGYGMAPDYQSRWDQLVAVLAQAFGKRPG